MRTWSSRVPLIAIVFDKITVALPRWSRRSESLLVELLGDVGKRSSLAA
jgi:hypothetical protein